METIKNVSISELHSFRNHPFKVETNTELCELMRSIEKEGVLVPLLVRTNPYGDGFEVISGHRRKEAALWAGETEVPVVIRELDDDQAVVAMVDSNLHRENLKPSEKAFAYRMKLEAMKHQGKKVLADDITLAQVEPRFAKKEQGDVFYGAMRSNELLAKQAGESVAQIKRYIRLTNLIPKILDMVDEGKIAFTVAVELSYLKEEEQYELHAIMDLEQCTPSLSQACRLKVMSQHGTLDMDAICMVLEEEKPNQREQIKLRADSLAKYFPEDYTPKQENLYATYTTVPERSFWRELAKCNQESFRQSGSAGKCIEARELIIALPESFVYYEPEYLLRRFTDHFKQNYKVECISALHHNKRKTNYHIHLIFAERQLLDKPIEKIATRNMFYDEKGKHRRTKKEILDEAGNIRKKCKVIKKGEVYEWNLFTKKNELFKADGFLEEVKRLYTDLINVCAIKEEDKLQVFDRNGMYLATKKIGKNNPKAAEIEADNMERARWNQIVDRALISGVAEEDILGVKREKISEEVKHSIELYGNNPSFLGDIIRLAIKALELLISKVLLAAAKVVEKIVDVVHEKVVEKEVPVLEEEPEQAIEMREKVQLPKKPEKPLLLSKYPVIMELDAELKRRNEEIFAVEQERSNLEIELSECTGVFKKKQRKELQERISVLDKKAEKMKSELSRVLRDAGYANAAEFFTELFAVREEKRKYEEACKEWQQECVRAEISIAREAFCNEETARRSEKRHR